MDTSLSTFRTAVLNLPAFQLTMYAAMVLILWFGGNMILHGSLTVGRLTSFLSYVLQVMNSLMMISNVFLLMTRSLASARRVAQVLDEPVELTSPKHPVTDIPDGGVRFEHVSFKYHPDAAEYALADIDLDIAPGQTVGILGGTGSAKSTLVQLIPRLYDATEGRGAGGRPGRAGLRPDGPAGRRGDRAAKERPVLGHGAGQPSLGRPRRRRRRPVGCLPGGLRR